MANLEIFGEEPGTRVVVSIRVLQDLCVRIHVLRGIPDEAPFIEGETAIEVDGIIDMFDYGWE